MACTGCGAEVPADFKFCGRCGAPLVPPSRAAELRQVTVLFCDIVDSTKLSAELDDEEYLSLVQGYHVACEQTIQRFGGHVAQYLGDGLLVYFGYPQAQEDSARRAIHAALAVLRTIETLPIPQTDESPKIAVRIGVHTGRIAAGEVGSGSKREQLPVGFSTNIAAAVQASAAPNTVVLSQATYELVRGFFEFEELGSHSLKGTEMTLFRALRETEARSRFDVSVARGLSPAVGRHELLGGLVERLERSQEGSGQVALLIGDAGIGKSRLLHRLMERSEHYGLVWLSCDCTAHQRQSAYHPLGRLLEQLLQVTSIDSPAIRLRCLEECLRANGLDLHEAVPSLAPLLSLPLGDDYTPIEPIPLLMKQRTFKSLNALLERVAAARGLVLAFEDLHWSDPSTLEFLTQWVAQSASARVLTVMTSRPGFTPPWGQPAHAVELSLNPLLRSQVEEMIHGITAGCRLPPEVLRQVVDASDGVPLFVEEMLKSLLESGHLRKLADRYEVVGAIHQLPVPATLEDLLAERLDRLGEARKVVQLAATLGREFRYEMLAAVWRDDEALLDRLLQEAVAADLFLLDGLPPDATYHFRHALIQEVAYGGRLRRERKADHQRIAEVMQQRFPQLCESQPEVLAYHCTEGGLVDLAIASWISAASLSNERSAHIEAVDQFQKALELLLTRPESSERNRTELKIQQGLSRAWVALRSYAAPEVETATSRAYELCHEMGETPELFWALWGVYAFYLMRSNYQRAVELGDQLLRLAETLQDEGILLTAHWGLLVVHSSLGDFDTAWHHVESALTLDPSGRDQILETVQHTMADVGSTVRVQAGTLLVQRGESERGRALAQEGIELARSIASPYTLANALNQYTWLLLHDRDPHAASQWAGQLIAQSNEQGYLYFSLVGNFLQGWADAACAPGPSADPSEEHRPPDEALGRMRQCFELARGAGAAMGASGWIGAMVEVYLQHGQVAEARDLIEQARSHVDSSGEKLYLAEHLRLRGEVLVATGRGAVSSKPQDAEELFDQAIQVARAQGTRTYELRATSQLAQLWLDNDQPERARDLLVSCRSQFNPEADSSAVRAADALLSTL